MVIGTLPLVFESDFLWKLQEMNLFMGSWMFFEEQMVMPGGFLTWISTWFTQLFFHPWLGVLVLCGWWLLLMWLVQRAFCLSRPWMALIILPVLFLLVTIVDMGYWLYILKLRGHVFVATIGTTVGVALLWAFRSICSLPIVHSSWSTWLRSAFVVSACAVGYPLLGIYGLAATAVMALWIWRLESRRQSSFVVSLTGILSVLVLPLLFYHFVYEQTSLADLYVVKLPLYVVTEKYTIYYLPYLLLLLFFMVLSTITPWRQKEKARKPATTLPVSEGAVVVILLLAALYTYSYWYKDENFHHELAMQRYIDRQDWEAVLKEAAKQENEPTRAIVMMRNLALARLGRQGDEMYRYKNGCQRCDAPFDIRAINSVGPLIYYHYGIPSFSYRLCMERGVEFGWRAEQLKFMVRCSIVNGELKIARKYLALLKQTMYHGAWADRMYALTEHPERIAQSSEMEFIRHMMHYDNELTNDHNLVENFLMKRLMFSNYVGDPVFLEQALYASMAAKNPDLFWPHLYNYSNFYPDRPWPVHVQEAVYLLRFLSCELSFTELIFPS